LKITITTTSHSNPDLSHFIDKSDLSLRMKFTADQSLLDKVLIEESTDLSMIMDGLVRASLISVSEN
jgi:hypothetical protein